MKTKKTSKAPTTEYPGRLNTRLDEETQRELRVLCKLWRVKASDAARRAIHETYVREAEK